MMDTHDNLTTLELSFGQSLRRILMIESIDAEGTESLYTHLAETLSGMGGYLCL
jgi:hypothetical protein